MSEVNVFIDEQIEKATHYIEEEIGRYRAYSMFVGIDVRERYQWRLEFSSDDPQSAHNWVDVFMDEEIEKATQEKRALNRVWKFVDGGLEETIERKIGLNEVLKREDW